MRRLLVSVVLLMCLPAELFAQEETAPKYEHDIEVSNLPLSLSIERVSEGLMATDIAAIAQDGTGFIWVGGQEGLARFDGHDFTIATAEGENSLGFGGKSVTSMTVDSAGVLYVGTYEKGLFAYEPKAGVFQPVEGPITPSITAVYSDKNDNLWVGYLDGGYSIRKADGTWGKLITSAEPFVVREFLQTEAGYWVATVDSGLFRLDKIDGGTELAYSSLFGHFEGEDDDKYLTSDAIADIAVDQDGALWIATANAGLSRLDPATHKVTSYTADEGKSALTIDTLTSVTVDQQNHVWVGSTSGFFLFDREQKVFHRFTSDDADPTTIAFNWVTTAFVDAQGVVWLGHFNNGLSKFHPDQLKSPLYRASNGALSLMVSGEVLWSGTYDGLWSYDYAQEQLTKYRLFRSEEQEFRLDGVWLTCSLANPTDKSIWASAFARGIVHFSPETGDFEYFDTDNSAIPSNSVKSMALGPKGNVWVGTFDAGLGKLNVSNAEWTSWDSTQVGGLGSDYVSVVQPDADGKHLWIGSTGSLLRLDPETMESTTYIHSADDPTTVPAGQVYALWQAGDVMWMGTSTGLAELNLTTGKAQRYTKADGLVHDQIYGVVESDDEVWLSTNGAGIQRLDASRKNFTTFVGDDGMQGLEYAQGSYAKLSDGRVVLGGTKGFNLISPKEMERTSHLGSLILTGVDVANKPVSFGRATWDANKVSMEHSSGIVKFKFASLSYAAPQLIRYRYRLKGFESDWREVGAEQRFATYTNLDGGDYIFEVMSREKGGEWGAATTMKLSVAPPLWKTWWAILIYIAIVGLVAAAYWRYQQQKLYSLEQEAKANKAENDLELTSAVQVGFLPKDNAVSTDLFGLIGYYRPAESCSGDWWWHETQSDGRISVLVGDVTGHGPGPAMVTAAVATAYRVQSLASNSTMMSRLEVLNDEVLRVSGGKYQMTLTAFTIDIDTGDFEIHSAGGLPVMRHENATKKASSLPCRGTPLGTQDPVIGNIKGTLNPGSRVIVYTDGIPEIDMPNGRQIGMRRFASLFGDTNSTAVPLASQHIVKTAEDYLAGRPQDDDWTFVILQWDGPGQLSEHRVG